MRIYINNDTDYSLEDYYNAAQEACLKALAGERPEIRAEIGVTFVTDEVIRDMNKTYRGKDRVTDVLTFPADTGPDGTLYGDIFICFDQAMRQALEIGNTGKREVAFLAVHGALHLLGYDHLDNAGEAVMIQRQREIMGALGYE